jgi:uncharacterized membrane protein
MAGHCRAAGDDRRAVGELFFVLIFRGARHPRFARLAKTDRGPLWLIGVFLLAISFSPVATALAGEQSGATPAVVPLSLVVFLAARLSVSMRR